MPTLFDVLMRHQLYLEGLKAWQVQQFNSTMAELQQTLRRLIAGIEYDTLDQMTQRELTRFMGKLRLSQRKIYNEYISSILNMLQEFIDVDVELMQHAMETTTGQTTEDAADENGFPFFISRGAALGTAAGLASLWAYIRRRPMGSSGQALPDFLTSFRDVATENVVRRFNRNVASAKSPSEAIKDIIGTKSFNYRDGALGGVARGGAAISNTSLQHVSSIVQAAVLSSFYEKYQWISIIDDVTSSICRELNLQVFVYGKGPLPPAHPNCRSHIVPVTADGSIPNVPTLYDWLRAQSAASRADLIGALRAQKFADGTSKASDYRTFTQAPPLTLKQFGAKRGKLTAG